MSESTSESASFQAIAKSTSEPAPVREHSEFAPVQETSEFTPEPASILETLGYIIEPSAGSVPPKHLVLPALPRHLLLLTQCHSILL
ncbi:hypothetical protein QQF64_014627 [Cirrhinus molitorella]|uniref:Uncharacterized protein n=1 Tax=Cirrhinus molitorella TaxID=172907 RepID=A0ABR3NT36_9TELE